MVTNTFSIDDSDPKLRPIYRLDLIPINNIFLLLDAFFEKNLKTSNEEALNKIKTSSMIKSYSLLIHKPNVTSIDIIKAIDYSKPLIPFYDNLELFRKNIYLYRFAGGSIRSIEKSLTQENIDELSRLYFITIFNHPLFKDFSIAKQLLRTYPSLYSSTDLKCLKGHLGFLDLFVKYFSNKTVNEWFLESDLTLKRVLKLRYRATDFFNELGDKTTTLSREKIDLFLFVLLYNMALDEHISPQDEMLITMGLSKIGIGEDFITQVSNEIGTLV